MVQSCVVVGCTNRWERGSKLSWHRIPNDKQGEKRRRWVTAIKRKNWTPRSQDRVCGHHFISGCASSDPNHPDYVPSLDMGYNLITSTPKVKQERHERARSRHVKRLDVEKDENDRQFAASVLVDLSSSINFDADVELSPVKELCDDFQYRELVEENDKKTEELAQSRLEHISTMQELQRLQEENRRLRVKTENNEFGVEFLKQGNSDKKTSFFTGVPNLRTFLWLVTFLENCLPAFSSVKCENVLMIVLMKLQLNSHNYDIATRFDISKTTVSDILNRCIPVIADQLKFLIHWPEKEDVLRTLPSVFKPKYRNARSIIDCTEIFIARPGNLTARASTWSNYKHNNTVKYLVSITPLGAISFISQAFGGRVSDKVVTQRSGYLDLLENGDLILADRGFLIGEEITSRNCFLAIPSFTKGQAQLTQQQVETSRYMSRVRIHVERAIGRLKKFNILSEQMSLNMVPHCDNILTICAAICNLQPRLVK